MLRENIEQQKKRELNLQRDEKTLLLSLSHDIKTPLSAIKLYAKALSKGQYESRDKQLEIAESIYARTKEIESYVSQIVTASKEDFLSCLLSGNLDRSVEVMQNIMENAVKYGDGNTIALNISEEGGCILVTVRNSGCTLADTDLSHVFNSFWRGANAERISGSGLGLYISRQLMCRMNGEIFAQIQGGDMFVTAVFTKA